MFNHVMYKHDDRLNSHANRMPGLCKDPDGTVMIGRRLLTCTFMAVVIAALVFGSRGLILGAGREEIGGALDPGVDNTARHFSILFPVGRVACAATATALYVVIEGVDDGSHTVRVSGRNSCRLNKGHFGMTKDCYKRKGSSIEVRR